MTDKPGRERKNPDRERALRALVEKWRDLVNGGMPGDVWEREIIGSMADELEKALALPERPSADRIQEILDNRQHAVKHLHMRYEASRDYLQLCAEIDHLRAAQPSQVEPLSGGPHRRGRLDAIDEVATLAGKPLSADAPALTADEIVERCASACYQDDELQACHSKCHDADVSEIRALKGTFTLAPSEERPREVLAAGEALLDKLDAIDKDASYKSIVTIAHIHGCDYTGPNWSAEYDALRAALSELRGTK
jgi:hypothetical protein